MTEGNSFPKTLQQAVKYFANPQHSHDFMVSIRWPDGVVKCPRCQSSEVSYISTRRIWKCKHCTTNKTFSVKVGTVMEDSAIPLEKWLCAFWLIANAKNGISSYEIHRSLGVTQKTGWFMLHRIRLAMQDNTFEKMSGRVEADETYIGGKARNMHAAKRRQVMGPKAHPWAGKVAVMGLLERGDGTKASRVRCKVVPNVKSMTVDPEVRRNVEKGSEVITDRLNSYCSLEDAYVHQVIDHAECYAKGHVHTNGMENFWSLLKRGIRGTYVSVEPFHLFRYLDEQAFRFNERKDNDQGRFLKVVSGMVGKTLKYKTHCGRRR